MNFKKTYVICIASMILANSLYFLTGCAEINEQAAGTEKSEAAAEVDTARNNDELFKTFTEKVNGKFTYSDDQITRDEVTGEITVTAVDYTLSVDEGAFEIEKRTGGSDKEIGELLLYSATALDSRVQPADITKAYEELKTTDGSKTVGNVTICSRSGENENSRHYTVSQAGKSQAAEADKDKEEKVKTAADTKKQQDQIAATDDKKDTEEKDTKDEKETANTSRDNTSSNTQSNSQNTTQAPQQSAPAEPVYTPQPTAPAAPAHVHNFSEPIYSTVHHDATGHYETVVTGQTWVVDQAAWDETETVPAYVCNACGWYSTNGNDASEIGVHIMQTHGGKSSYHSDYVQVGIIHHDEVGHYVDVTEDRWVQDSAAYDEQVIVGYRCSCGATQ